MFFTAMLLLSLVACGDQVETSDEKNVEDSIEENTESGQIKVEKEAFDVHITLPPEFCGKVTQKDLDAAVSRGEFHAATLNGDGSVTYEMSKSQHQKMIKDLAASVDQMMSEMVGSEEYPNVTRVEANRQYNHFTVTTKSTELDYNEKFVVLSFYMLGGMYATFNGDSDIEITVDFVNADSGKLIESANSSETAG